MMGDKKTSTFVPARGKGSSQWRAVLRLKNRPNINSRHVDEIIAESQLYMNNWLINTIAAAAGRGQATYEELVEIRGALANVGEMMAASPMSVATILPVLGIDGRTVVHYPLGQGPNEHLGNGHLELHIFHTGGNHFIARVPNRNNYYWSDDED